MGSTKKAASVFLALGSNLGDRQQNIETAYRKIEERIGRIASSSAFYFSKPEGFESENFFINSVCEVTPEIDIYRLFAITQSIEKEMGRRLKSSRGGYADRIIDIDLLLAGDQVIDSPKLIVPHPRMHLRDFVLTPLSEIAPDVIHPVLKKTIRQLKEAYDASPRPDGEYTI